MRMALKMASELRIIEQSGIGNQLNCAVPSAPRTFRFAEFAVGSRPGMVKGYQNAVDVVLRVVADVAAEVIQDLTASNETYRGQPENRAAGKLRDPAVKACSTFTPPIPPMSKEP
jgi:hypothetical protein